MASVTLFWTHCIMHPTKLWADPRCILLPSGRQIGGSQEMFEVDVAATSYETIPLVHISQVLACSIFLAIV